jgi:HRAS-like suppressor 3
MSSDADERFAVGDHLQVPGVLLFYNHHGIYLGSSQVMEFAGGVHPIIRRVSLAQFESRGPATLLLHQRLRTWTMDAGPLDPEEVVNRAYFLEKEVPEHRYNFLGFNCEHAANWCKTGLPESYQVKAGMIFGIAAQIVTFALAPEDRRATTTLKVGAPVFLTTVLYQTHSYFFWRDIGKKWRSQETS